MTAKRFSALKDARGGYGPNHRVRGQVLGLFWSKPGPLDGIMGDSYRILRSVK